jgi:antitoxin component YwqK of YwqJK toxin-antitoxin module
MKTYLQTCILVLGLLSFYVAKAGDPINQIDANGLRQGYWIITGNMINDHNYGPAAKVEEGLYKNSNKEGVWKKYWPNSKIKAEITYTNGSPQGWYRTYYETGACEEEGGWWNNKNTGYFNRWHPNGKPQQMFQFADNGKRMGLQRYFYDNGNTELEVEMKNGSEQGLYRRFHPDGTVAEEKVFDQGKVVPGSEKVYKAVPKRVDIPTKDPYDPEVGKEVAPTISKPNKAEIFKPNGFNSLYNSQGQLTEVGEFKNSKLLNGKCYHYNNNGLLTRIEIYRNGKYIGNGIIGDAER